MIIRGQHFIPPQKLSPWGWGLYQLIWHFGKSTSKPPREVVSCHLGFLAGSSGANFKLPIWGRWRGTRSSSLGEVGHDLAPRLPRTSCNTLRRPA